ncbi:hypothetical protein ONS95_010824 [Cadophora gregata]|uniref:uncharacterized protein n=1 Tax=Cadophora gregata TaxID=51156 RepID=UPI0026DB3FEA|nr:uncharacterized protein ONS95_010824 [Cadophora gregata]KAK0119373.1 hypothetical protein ONS95_010824 [Cadophora gregata]
MDKAKAAVGSFLHKDGKHDTTVHETVNPAITNENVTRTQHEKVTTAVDREVHQDHYHTSVQPIKDREVLPEQHTHQMAGVETRNLKHGSDDHVKERLAAEQAQFKNTRTVGDTQHTSSANPVIAGEHIHHHVHENIQPVIQKETIQPSVVHTTVPVHEVHQNEAKHHTATTLPPVTMDEFKKQGGHLSGRDERTDAFAGEPRAVGGTLGGAGARGTTSLTEKDGHHNSHGTHGNGSGVATGSGVGSTNSHSTANATGHKPSLLDKLNPKKDADGDGKAGFMK